MPNDFSAREGARFRLDSRPAHTEPFECKVLEIDPPRRLRAQWIVRGQPTTVTFELHADAAGTVLRVEQPNFDGGWGAKFANDLPLVLDGTRDPADAEPNGSGLISHPAMRSRPEE